MWDPHPKSGHSVPDLHQVLSPLAFLAVLGARVTSEQLSLPGRPRSSRPHRVSNAGLDLQILGALCGT